MSRTRVVPVLVALAVVASVVASPVAAQQVDGEPRFASRVAYMAVDEVTQTAGGPDASVDLFVSDVSEPGAPPRRLTDTAGADGIPFVWSPDGTRLVVGAAFRFDPSGSVFVVGAFGNVVARLAERADSFDWTADGARVVLGLGDRVWTVAEDGTDPRELFTVPPIERFGEQHRVERVEVDWAPAGRMVKVVASAMVGHDPDSDVWFVDADTGAATRVAGADGSMWGPDGRAFAYARDGQIVVAPADDPSTEIARVGPTDGWGSDNPVWRADSGQIAFLHQQTWEGGAALWVADADGSDQRLVGDLPGIDHRTGSWSPDGSTIAVTGEIPDDDPALTDRYLALVDVATGVVDVRVKAEYVQDPEWLHDGSAVVADVLGASGHPGWHVVVVAAGGGQPRFLTNPSEQVRPDNSFALGSDVAPVRFRDTARLMGADRVATAVALSRSTFDTAGSVVLARSDLYPDALAGTPLAHRLAAPLLLTPGDRLNGRVAGEIRRLGASHAVVLGTQAALSEQVVADLRGIGVTKIERIGGSDRFATAALIADRLGAGDVFVAEGVHADPARGWPDAVAVSALAAVSGRAILLTAHNVLPDATADWLADNRPGVATIVGGELAVSAAVEQQVAARAQRTERLSGTDRYAVSRRIAELSVTAGLSPSVTFLVTGNNWPDALGAGVTAARQGSVLLLIPSDPTGTNASGQWLAHNRTAIDTGILVGGLAALSARAQRDVAGLIAD